MKVKKVQNTIKKVRAWERESFRSANRILVSIEKTEKTGEKPAKGKEHPRALCP